jgi:rhodanese-related sulfurtransferase
MMKTAAQMIAEAKARTPEVTPQQVMEMQARGEPLRLLDVREPQEVNAAKIPGAVAIPRGQLETTIEAQMPRDARVVIYCASGNRSAFAAVTMQEMGYTNVASMAGGIRAWADAGGEIE